MAFINKFLDRCSCGKRQEPGAHRLFQFFVLQLHIQSKCFAHTWTSPSPRVRTRGLLNNRHMPAGSRSSTQRKFARVCTIENVVFDREDMQHTNAALIALLSLAFTYSRIRTWHQQRGKKLQRLKTRAWLPEPSTPPLRQRHSNNITTRIVFT